ncbi:Hypothetical_protein [Hexamita inflata]|uniref:Hypothetical_protein n=1 Tax=Hexamita inflata TaxID=28002 RepID=A0AA86NPH3_9EUKA|nr:Hypothetical protein HINF_LOCUS10959 [Hexamita inflata]
MTMVLQFAFKNAKSNSDSGEIVIYAGREENKELSTARGYRSKSAEYRITLLSRRNETDDVEASKTQGAYLLLPNRKQFIVDSVSANQYQQFIIFNFLKWNQLNTVLKALIHIFLKDT